MRPKFSHAQLGAGPNNLTSPSASVPRHLFSRARQEIPGNSPRTLLRVRRHGKAIRKQNPGAASGEVAVEHARIHIERGFRTSINFCAIQFGSAVSSPPGSYQ
jgi:hypothetical protein